MILQLSFVSHPRTLKIYSSFVKKTISEYFTYILAGIYIVYRQQINIELHVFLVTDTSTSLENCKINTIALYFTFKNQNDRFAF